MFVAYVSSLDLCASSFLNLCTYSVWSPNLTLFVETKWAEWHDLFSHDGLRGKVLLCYTGLLISIELRHLFYLLRNSLLCDGIWCKCVDRLDPRGLAGSCYVSYRLGFITS